MTKNAKECERAQKKEKGAKSKEQGRKSYGLELYKLRRHKKQSG